MDAIDVAHLAQQGQCYIHGARAIRMGNKQ